VNHVGARLRKRGLLVGAAQAPHRHPQKELHMNATTPEIRARVARSPEALYSPPRRNARRRRCDNHLADPHWIEPGALVMHSALPPDSDVGNLGWWHNSLCAACWPAEWAGQEPPPLPDTRPPHEVRHDVDRDPDSGAVLSWSVRL